MAKDLWHKVSDKDKSGKGVRSPPFSLSPFHQTSAIPPRQKESMPCTAGTWLPHHAPFLFAMHTTSILPVAEALSRRGDATDAMGRQEQHCLGRRSRLHALSQSDASLAAPSRRHVRAPFMMRVCAFVREHASLLGARYRRLAPPSLLACQGLTPRPPIDLIADCAWPTTVVRESPGAKVPWVMERCAAHIEQYGLQVNHPLPSNLFISTELACFPPQQRPTPECAETRTQRKRPQSLAHTRSCMSDSMRFFPKNTERRHIQGARKR